MKVDGPNRINENGDSQIKVRVTTQRQTSTWMGLYVQGGLPVGYMGWARGYSMKKIRNFGKFSTQKFLNGIDLVYLPRFKLSFLGYTSS